MRAVVVTGLGGPEVLQLTEVPDPVAGDGQAPMRSTWLPTSTGSSRCPTGSTRRPPPRSRSTRRVRRACSPWPT
ncbi:hypothetical protein ACFQX7_24765 [Luedemannella flava]